MAARKAHNLEVGGSNPPPATKNYCFYVCRYAIIPTDDQTLQEMFAKFRDH